MIIVRRPALVERIRDIARETNRDTTQVVETAVEAYLDQLDRDRIHKETETFWAMQADLVASYSGEYVAMHQGRVVDHDFDIASLEERIAERLGEIPVLIAPVTDEPRRDLLTVSFRLEP
jgi:predicted transcriptional regulator